ncbi:hypothetical protein [Halegenticoccus tardaugens]|uniref:hypothetical protein n=1 Tax=Halegenticoccus tardaugens TaxID=2071624 RepID=UPI00100BB67F|nr:hypothetical protein [Halegenticoccus tardaugens]
MSVNLRKRSNIGLLLALIVATIAVMVLGLMWFRGRGEPLVVEVAYGSLVLIAALFVYDKLLVQ